RRKRVGALARWPSARRRSTLGPAVGRVVSTGPFEHIRGAPYGCTSPRRRSGAALDSSGPASRIRVEGRSDLCSAWWGRSTWLAMLAFTEPNSSVIVERMRLSTGKEVRVSTSIRPDVSLVPAGQHKL